MPDIIGINRRWFQPKSFPHYDICISKRNMAIKNGAIAVSPKDLVRKIKELRNG
jgi:hypothetical protein